MSLKEALTRFFLSFNSYMSRKRVSSDKEGETVRQRERDRERGERQRGRQRERKRVRERGGREG